MSSSPNTPAAAASQYDAVLAAGTLLANKPATAKKRSFHHFENAKSDREPGVDFRVPVSPVEFVAASMPVKQERQARNQPQPPHSFQSTISLTGSNADDRYTTKPSERACCTGDFESTEQNQASFSDKRLNEGISLAADQQKAAGGNAPKVVWWRTTAISRWL